MPSTRFRKNLVTHQCSADFRKFFGLGNACERDNGMNETILI